MRKNFNYFIKYNLFTIKMKKCAKNVLPKKKITDFFASTKSPNKDSMQIEEEEKPSDEPAAKANILKDGSLLPLDDFISELNSWKPKLKHFTDSQKFKNTYTFIKKEYENKTVFFKKNFLLNLSIYFFRFIHQLI